MTIGFGYDVHPLVPGRKLVLGGVQIEYPRGLMGHSDADVLIHSICDALLGAAGMGDIGLHFPDSDHAFKDKPSSFFLRTVADLLRQRGKIIQNIDSVIIAQEPPLSPFFHRMRQIVAHTAGIDLTKVNLKAKSPEHVGSFGRGEAIAAYSVALLTETPGQKNCSAPQSQSPSPD